MDGQTGLLAPPGGDGAGGAIARLLEDAQLRQNLGAAGARHVTERYSLEAMLRAFDVYLHRMAGWNSP
jgi:glycosyltransferase involved in cell wall biosynthesis